VLPFVGRAWPGEAERRDVLRSHIAELSVRFARFAGGSAISRVSVSCDWGRASFGCESEAPLC
jgi:hypothetical protein